MLRHMSKAYVLLHKVHWSIAQAGKKKKTASYSQVHFNNKFCPIKRLAYGSLS